MALAPPTLIARRAEDIAARRLRAARAVVVNGPRQCGKTALLGILQSQLGGTYLSLDQATNLRLVRTDPTGFVTGFDEPLFIDEVQRGGDPLILAGSQRDRRDFFADYVRTVTGKDVRELADLAHMARLRQTVRLLSARTGQELNVSDLGRKLGIPVPTLRRYGALLERSTSITLSLPGPATSPPNSFIGQSST